LCIHIVILEVVAHQNEEDHWDNYVWSGGIDADYEVTRKAEEIYKDISEGKPNSLVELTQVLTDPVENTAHRNSIEKLRDACIEKSFDHFLMSDTSLFNS
jgi:hypothetical protein